MTLVFDPLRKVGYEARKSHLRRCRDGFYARFIPGPRVLDIGYRGGEPDALPIVDGAVGIEPGYPGYDGYRLPFEDGFVDCVFASHVLEHVAPPDDFIRDWLRVLRVGGTMIVVVPHAYLYERRLTVPPSRWSPEHLFSVTPSSLLGLVERSLTPNTWRLRHLADNDRGYDYSLPIDRHPSGCLEIEMVVEKISAPKWNVEP